MNFLEFVMNFKSIWVVEKQICILMYWSFLHIPDNCIYFEIFVEANAVTFGVEKVSDIHLLSPTEKECPLQS